jgi:hypothetical protein
MAIRTSQYLLDDYPVGFRKSIEYTRLVKTDIVRQGISGWGRTMQKTRIPHDAKSAKQIGVRCLVKFIFQQWWTLTPEQQLTWKPFYLMIQMDRWMNFQAPSRDNPATEASDPISISGLTSHTGKGFATLSFTPSAATNIYGLIIFRSPTEITDPSYQTAIVMIRVKTTDPISYCDSPLRPGTYHYRAAVFTTDGVMGPVYPDFSVPVF